MQTPPILPTLNAAPVAPARSADSGASDQQFTQMLSRQMSQRESGRAAPPQMETAKSSPSKPTAAAPPAGGDDNANRIDTAALAQSADAAAPQNSAVAVDTKTTSASKIDEKEKPVLTTGEDPTDATLAASAAIMALVANAGVATAKAVEPSTTNPTVSTAPVPTTAAFELSKLQRAGVNVELEAIDPKGMATAANGRAVNTDTAGTAATPFTAALQAVIGGAADNDSGTAKNNNALLATTPDGANVLQHLPQPIMNFTLPTGPMPGNTLAPTVGAKGWDQTLGQRMVWMVAGSEQSASLTLNPPDLGPLQVVLHVSNGQADASFYAAQPEVRQALEAALPRLREMMAESGISLGQASVSADNPQQRNETGQGSAGSARRTGTAQSDTPIVIGGTRMLGTGNGLVDTFA